MVEDGLTLTQEVCLGKALHGHEDRRGKVTQGEDRGWELRKIKYGRGTGRGHKKTIKSRIIER